MSPRFQPRRAQPLKPDSYRRLARLVRQYAERIEAAAERADPQQKKSVTDALNGLYRLVVHYWHRHHGRNPAREQAKDRERRIELDRLRGE